MVGAVFVGSPSGSDLWSARSYPSAGPSAAHLAVAFVFDDSFGISRKDWPVIQRAAGAIASALRPGDTGATVMTLDRLMLMNAAGTDPTTLAQTFAVLPVPGLSRKMLWDAVLAGSSLVATGPGRPVVVCFSDGARDFGWTARKDALDTLTSTGVVIDAVTVPNIYLGQTNWDDVKKVPGSLVIQASDSRLGEQISAQFDRLRQGHVLAYHPAGQ